MTNENKHTPLMEQYFAIKEKHPGYLLFFRLGDFYEMFFDDAKQASTALDIALTKRGREAGQDIPMCGVPVHSHEMYLARLIRKGFKIAICEQTEDPEQARKLRGSTALINRDVIRLITPGTLTEENILQADAPNYLLSLTQTSDGIGIAWADISTGLFNVQTLPDKNSTTISTAIARLEPKEIVISDKLIQAPEYFETFNDYKRLLTPLPPVRFSPENGKKRLEDFYHVSTLDAFGTFNSCELGAAGALLDYVELTQKGQHPRLNTLQKFTNGSMMEIDSATRRNLELFHSLSGDKKGSLFYAIDRTKTATGTRLLYQYLSTPLTNIQAINERLDRIEFFTLNRHQREKIQNCLMSCPDMERSLSRLSLGRAGPRDLAVFRDTLNQIPTIKNVLAEEENLPPAIQRCFDLLDAHEQLALKLTKALADDLPLLARDGGFIRPGYSAELDELKSLRDDSRQMIAGLQSKYAEIAGIPSLKVAHNNILGFYVEVSAKNGAELLDKARSGQSIFLHRQTMSNAIRFTTVELSELESKLKGVAEKVLSLELDLFADLANDIMNQATTISQTAHYLAVLDVASSLALLAETENYTRPIIEDSLAFDIEQGRHPIVEQKMAEEHNSFIGNDCRLGNPDTKDGRLWLITGPNMAGKSTFLRQNALIAILAQAGCFVPAKKAVIGIVDKVFSRVGAADDLARGRSTFMVEMVETAAILNQSTPKSLVILDEIGRGTATFDGLSIAWAVCEHLHNTNQARALFATHYHELTALSELLPHLSLYTMKIKEWKGNVVFLHEVMAGSADRSYGIHVGKLAGLPPVVITRAKQVLEQLEKKGANQITFMNDLPLFAMLKEEEKEKNSPVVEEEFNPVLDSLKQLDLDSLTPKQALDELYKLKSLIK
ncbi:MAG: DNA mismatch repair protein MutS [Alphaproteobacteria bacterium]|nr:DNA mismatch repair protein MutS [Alphaproteobacteria bacterium]